MTMHIFSKEILENDYINSDMTIASIARKYSVTAKRGQRAA